MSSIIRKEALDIVKIVLPIVIAIFGSAWRLSSQIEEMERFGWTLHDQREWAKEVHTLNPTLIVPDPNEIFWGSHGDPGLKSKRKSFFLFPSLSADVLAKDKP